MGTSPCIMKINSLQIETGICFEKKLQGILLRYGNIYKIKKREINLSLPKVHQFLTFDVLSHQLHNSHVCDNDHNNDI